MDVDVGDRDGGDMDFDMDMDVDVVDPQADDMDIEAVEEEVDELDEEEEEESLGNAVVQALPIPVFVPFLTAIPGRSHGPGGQGEFSHSFPFIRY